LHDNLLPIFVKDSVNGLLMMFLPLIADAFHLFGDVLESLEHLDQLLARDDQERALHLSDGRAVPLVPLILCPLLVRVREYV
jgi:hypothetical protein